MIETQVICNDPLIIYQKIHDFFDEHDTIIGVKKAIAVIQNAVIDRKTFNLLIDFSELKEASKYKMPAHKKWAEGFKNNGEINKSIRKVAVVAMDSPKFRAEKECMENESYKWFTDFQAALAWLKFFNTKKRL
jgi:hypothetical protein